jgi:integrase
LRGEYGSKNFVAAYEAAVRGERPPKPGAARHGTLGWLFARYKEAGFGGCKPSTAKQRENILKSVLATAGDSPLASVTKGSIARGRDKRAAVTPAAANNFIKTMRALFTWAVDAELADSDPTEGIAWAVNKSEGHEPWTDDEIAAFEARWPTGTRERLALAIFLNTGLRRGDAAILGRQHVKDGVITLRTEKTGEVVVIPILQDLQRAIDATPQTGMSFIARPDGRPMVKEGFGNWFGEACRAAGVKKSAHGLRKSAATHAAERGATVAQLEAIFGWRGGRMASHYTKSANRVRLAREAIEKLARAK